MTKINEGSDDTLAMIEYWTMVDSIVRGIRAVRAGREVYLPRFPHESSGDYEFRLKTSTMTNVYNDVLQSIVDKPFADEVSLQQGTSSPALDALVEDIDGRGNNLTVFLRDVFLNGINSSIDWILVDFPVVDTTRILTVAEERSRGLRPYWVRVPARNVLEVRTSRVSGVERVTYVRIAESSSRVREFDTVDGRVVWRVYEPDNTGEYRLIANGIVSINIIPMVSFITGQREGNSWRFIPPLRDAAELQIELYQKETGLKNIETLTCFPMLAANGIEPDRGPDGRPRPVPLGPNAVLYAPPNDAGGSGSWTRIGAEADSLRFISEQVDKLIQRIRELGKQPLTAQSSNTTRINSAFAASKANSAAQRWALGLKDATELALFYTALWLNDPVQPEVNIFVDFPIDSDTDTTPEILLTMRERGDLSQITLWNEMKRRRVLGSNFNSDTESATIAEEIPSDEVELIQ